MAEKNEDKKGTKCCGEHKGGCPRNICCGHCPDNQNCPYNPCTTCISNANKKK